MKGKFVEGEQRSVPANDKEKALDVILPSALADKYDVEKLDTSGLPAEDNGYKITWVNNFRLKLKSGKSKKSTTKIDFEVQFEKPDLGGLVNQRLFIHDGSSVSMPDNADFADLGNGKIAARLKGDDPSIGWGGT
jgi:hypothetical protein